MMYVKSTLSVCAAAAIAALAPVSASYAASLECGETYKVRRGDSLSRISLKAYDSLVYQPIYTENVDIIGSNPDLIKVGQRLMIPCLSALADEADDDAVVEGQLVFTFNKASAPPFVINSGIIDAYLAEITEVTEGRVTFVDPDEVNRDHSQQLALVTSGEVDAAYVLNAHLAESHPLLQLPMIPMFGGSAEQTAVSLWRLHEDYLAQTSYFPEAEILGFVSAPAAHIWRTDAMPVTVGENIVDANMYPVPYFNRLDTHGPAVVREEFAGMLADYSSSGMTTPAFFMAHGAALATGLWTETSNVSVMEVDAGLYTPTFTVVLSNDAWAQISAADQAAIRAVSGEALAHRSSAWDDFDNAFRSRMLDAGLKTEKADKELIKDLWVTSLGKLATWMQSAEGQEIMASEAINSYLTDLASLEDRLIYRGDASFVDTHPFWTAGH